jgi:hypothetical protein
MRFFEKNIGIAPSSEKVRRSHELWLDRAMRRNGPELRIPRRRADRGGFGVLMSHPAGRFWAERWWVDAIARADEIIGT